MFLTKRKKGGKVKSQLYGLNATNVGEGVSKLPDS